MQTVALSRPRLGVLLGALLLVGAVTVRVLWPAAGGEALPDLVRDFVTLTLSVIIESLPFVFLGILLSIVVRVWLPAGLLLRVLPRNAAVRRPVLSLLGVLLPVCECGNVPLTRGLVVRGVSVSDSMTFLLAAPILNPVTIITTFQVFGWDNGVLIARVVGAFLIANLVGWIFSRHPSQQSLLTSKFQDTCAAEHDHEGKTGRLMESLSLFRGETGAMMPALFVGCAIAGLIQVAVSRDILVALGSDPVWSVLALMALAFVVSLCSNVDAFFVLALGSTFMPGSIVAFLVFGPMVDVKMLALLRTTFTTRTLVTLSAIVALASAALGLGVNLLRESLINRWAGIALTLLTVIGTVWLGATGNLDLYVHPRYFVFTQVLAIAGGVMAVAALLFLPTREQDEHGHEHHADGTDVPRWRGAATTAPLLLLVAASAVALLALPPTTLSSSTARNRELNAASVTQTSTDTVQLTGSDSSAFTVKDWAGLLRQGLPDSFFANKSADVTGFVLATDSPDTFYLTRFLITHCALDAQPIGIPVHWPGWQEDVATDDWVALAGDFRANPSPGIDAPVVLVPTQSEQVAEPDDPYVY